MRTFPDAFRFAASAAASALVGRRVLSCLWELTYRCTARCTICSYWRRPSHPDEELSLAEVCRGLDRLHAHGLRAVNFTGGEPTIRGDLEDIVHHASRLGMWTSMVTNGSLMTRGRMMALKRAGLDNLLVSLDSADPHVHDRQRGIRGLHEKAVRCARWVSEDFLTGHRTGGIMCVIASFNSRDVDRLVRLGEDLDVYVVLQPYHDNKTGNDDLNAAMGDEYLEHLLLLRRRTRTMLCSERYLRGFAGFGNGGRSSQCHAGRKYFSIDPYGYLHPCVDMPRVGHVLTDDLSVVRSESALRSVSACKGCWYAFRGEADTSLSYRGCLEKLRLGLTVLARNTRRRLGRRRSIGSAGVA